MHGRVKSSEKKRTGVEGTTQRRIASVIACLALIAFACLCGSAAQQKKKDIQPPAPAATITAEQASQLEAVITTDLGVIRFEFYFDKAPKHVQQFVKLARSGSYDGSAFFRVIARGVVQGGDPLLKDPQTPRERWGTGALKQITDEFSDLKHVRGTVSTVRVPGQVNSGGAQFFICASPQPQLDGQYSVFGQVTEGIDVVDKISLLEADARQLTVKPVKITSIKIEPKKLEPFKNATVDELRKEVLLRTSLGDITLELDPNLAPEHVRNFLKLTASGWYDHTAFQRIIPGFVAQGGAGSTRAGGAAHPADRWVRKLKAEFTPTLHIRGVLSMARANDPNSADTSFFIMLGRAEHLDGKYSVFGKVIDGFDTLDKIESVPRNGETPVGRVELIEAIIKQ